MGLLPLEYTDCLADTPHYRENLKQHEKELDRTNLAIKGLIKDVKDLLAAAKILSRAQRSLAKTLEDFKFDCIGCSQTDDEIVIAGSLKEFGRLFGVIEDERDRMLERAQATLIDPIEHFRKNNIGAAKEAKKKFEKETARFCGSLERHLNLSTKKGENHLQEADASLGMEQLHFFRASVGYASLLTEIQERKKFEFVETITSFMCGIMTFYHQGYEIAMEFKTFMNDLQRRIQRIRENFQATHNEAELLKERMLEKTQDPGILNKMYTRQGYLFLMEKKALGSTWTKHFCQYQKSDKKFSLMPYSQTTGKIMNGETVTVKECIGRQCDSIDKRFCFDVVPEDKTVVFTFQALSDEDRKLWLDAMDGVEMTCSGPGKNLKLDEFYLDDAGFSFIQNCISFIEVRGLTDQGLYRLVGVNSKVTKLLQMALDQRKANNVNIDVEEWEIKTVTSAVKNYFRNLPEPLLTFRLHGAFIAAAKQESKNSRVNNIHTLVHSLPHANFQMLDILIRHLSRISKMSDKNLMTVSNLGVCFGPTLLRPEEETVAAIMDIKFGNVVIEMLIENSDEIFASVPDAKSVRQVHPPPYIDPPPPHGNRSYVEDHRHAISPALVNRAKAIDTQVYYNLKPKPLHSPIPPTNYSSKMSPPPSSEKPSWLVMYNPLCGDVASLQSANSDTSNSWTPPRSHKLLNDYDTPNRRAESVTSLPSPTECSACSDELNSKLRNLKHSNNNISDPLINSTHTCAAKIGSGRKARTLFACRADNETELSFQPNELIYDVQPSQEPGWVRGRLRGKSGLVPENYVEYLT